MQPNAYKKCPKCGATHALHSHACHCGHTFRTQFTAPQAPYGSAYATTQMFRPPTFERKLARFWMWLGSILSVFVILYVCNAFRYDGPSSTLLIANKSLTLLVALGVLSGCIILILRSYQYQFRGAFVAHALFALLCLGVAITLSVKLIVPTTEEATHKMTVLEASSQVGFDDTQFDVRRRLGNPDQLVKHSGIETWTYQLTDGQFAVGFARFGVMSKYKVVNGESIQLD